MSCLKLGVLDIDTEAGNRPRRWLTERVALMPPLVESAIALQGLRAAPARARDSAVFQAAEDCLERVLEFASSVAAHVGRVHVIDSKPGYDVSHSEPQWSTRIFVSIPERADEVGAIRLAESVLHEAMHLALTGFEQRNPVVFHDDARMVSPWRAELRPIGGVVHGLFVFACIRRFLSLLPHSTDESVSLHVERRIKDINAEINEIDLNQLGAGLTPLGRDLATRWVMSAARKEAAS